MTLEELFKEAASKGMTHFTLYPVESQDRKTIYWCARATPSTGHSYVQTQTLDPIEAITQTLLALPKAPKRAKSVDAKPSKVTDPVTEPEPVHPAENIGSMPGRPKKTQTLDELDPPEPEGMDAWLPKT